MRLFEKLGLIAALTAGVLGAPSFALATEVEELFDLVDSNCAGNDNGSIVTYDVSTLNVAKELARIKAQDIGKYVDCSENRRYSKSKVDAVAQFKNFVAKNDYAASCIDEYLTGLQRRELLALVSDPENVAVISSVYGTNDNGEACDYNDFWIYRADGTVVQFTFDYTD